MTYIHQSFMPQQFQIMIVAQDLPIICYDYNDLEKDIIYFYLILSKLFILHAEEELVSGTNLFPIHLNNFYKIYSNQHTDRIDVMSISYKKLI